MRAAVSSGLEARDRVPQLVSRFAVLTAVGLAVAATVIVAVVQRAYTLQGEQQAIAQARYAAEVVLHDHLSPSDLTGPLSPGRRRALDQLFTQAVLVDGPGAAALYDTDAGLNYSVGASRVDFARPGIGALVRQALTGRVIARVGSSGLPSGRVLRTFLPLAYDGRVRGVVVLEQDFQPIASASRHAALVIAGVLEGVLVVLFALLIPMLARATTRIRSQVGALDRLATHDELTGLPNRFGFQRAVERLTGLQAARGALMLVDIDSFHELNDTLGSDNGDRLLIEIANRLSALQQSPPVARLGEDEFGLLLEGADEHEVQAVAARIGAALEQPLELNGARVSAEVTLGAALIPAHGVDLTTLLKHAGVALTNAKEAPSRLEIYDVATDTTELSKLTLTGELRQALREGQLLVYYQPQADLAMNVVRGVEALVRWQHPQLGLLEAKEFMPLAERNGLVSEIDRFVLETTADQWQRWQSIGLLLDVAVNISAVDLLDPELAERTKTLIWRHGLPPEYLILEITEHTLLRNEQRAKHTLERLRQIGVRLAVDDYGTGYSSLRYLRSLPAQQVKLDGTFTSGIPDDTTNVAIVGSTIALAHELGATVVAEGVESLSQWNHLAALNCDIAQGHLVGMPQAADELTEQLIATERSIRPALRLARPPSPERRSAAAREPFTPRQAGRPTLTVPSDTGVVRG